MLGLLIHLHVVISSKNKWKQSNSIQTLAGQMKPPYTLLTWEGGILFELVSYWLASDDMMLYIHALQHFNIKLY